ncbi:hypothetical protein SARC_11429, partial [Sphaeroforma arctica JP610]
MATNRLYEGNRECTLDQHVRQLLQQQETAAAVLIDDDAQIRVTADQEAQLRRGTVARVDAPDFEPKAKAKTSQSQSAPLCNGPAVLSKDSPLMYMLQFEPKRLKRHRTQLCQYDDSACP